MLGGSSAVTWYDIDRRADYIARFGIRAGVLGAYVAQSSLRHLPEVFLSTAELSPVVTRAARRGKVRKLGPRLYTSNLSDAPEAVIHRNLWPVVGLLFPDTVVSHRTALEAKPTPAGTVFVTGAYDRVVELPGLRVRQLKGPGPLDGDNRFVQSLWIASQPRAILECLGARRIRGTESPSLPRAEIESKLEALIRRGEDVANSLRDRARAIASELGAEETFRVLDAVIGAMLGTRKAILTAHSARARAAGEPYDPERIDLFRTLFEALVSWDSALRPDVCLEGDAFRNLAFADAYFSNFIEGTEFEVEEAIAIVFEGMIPRNRPQDAHDIVGTFRLVGSAVEMKLSASAFSTEFEGFLALLKRRHATILEGRPDKRPGEFKIENNRAGQTVFVVPELMPGTLRQGLEMFRSLEDPFKRAAFMMFVISEVHPFDDGNGRVARTMMNAELISGGQRRILIPNAFREDYLLALRALSRHQDPVPLLKVLDRAQAFSAAVEFADLQAALATLRACHAFDTGDEARLRMPS
jgi:hypothetical protein